MILDIIDDKLFIKDINSNLKPRHKSQLNAWGFAKDQEGNLLWVGANIKTILPKVIKYFDKSYIDYSLSNSSKQLLEIINKVSNEVKELAEICRKFKDGDFETDDFTEHVKFLKENIPRKLKEHQIKASYHLFLIGKGANFSVPGSGKTTVVLSVYERLHLQGRLNTLFVVGPPSCFGPWKDEFHEVLGRVPNCTVLSGGNKVERKNEYFRSEGISELYLTTFNTLLNDQDDVCLFLKNRNVDAFLIIDEAHYIKQINGNWANAVLKIAKHSKFRCVLTGTPIPKSYTDLYNLFDFLWPDYNIISSDDKVRLHMLEEKKDYESSIKILEPTIGPFFYRVRKSELGLKPQVFQDPEIIQMNPYERKLYDAIAKKIRNYANEDYLQNIEIVKRLQRGRMIRIRQCLSYSKLLNTAIEDYNECLLEDNNDLKHIISNYDNLETPAKINQLIKLIETFQEREEKAVIWAHFIGTIKLIEQTLKNNGYNCKKIIGATPTEQTTIYEEETREKIINEFVSKKSGLDILLANPAACAESISLHKTCHNAVYYDLSYNCAQYLQSLDRIHRVGGSEYQEAYYYYLQYEDTIDSDILSKLEEKSQKMYDIIDGNYNIYSLDMFEDNDELAAYDKLFAK
ncbi:MAG: DEAD/DEAH box helicase [Candidatus Scalindua sp.]